MCPETIYIVLHHLSMSDSTSESVVSTGIHPTTVLSFKCCLTCCTRKNSLRLEVQCEPDSIQGSAEARHLISKRICHCGSDL